jgi:hypothetical protein
MTGAQRLALRGVGAGRMLVGLGTLLSARSQGHVLFDSLPPRAIVAARVLAVRDLVQGGALMLTPEDSVSRAADYCTAIDSLHAASMLPLVAFSSRYRMAATLSAASAAVWLTVTPTARRS